MSSGNSALSFPSITSVAASTMASAVLGSRSPSSMLARAQARLMIPSARMNEGGNGIPLTGKFSTARAVEAPYMALSGTRISPIESFSIRNFDITCLPVLVMAAGAGPPRLQRRHCIPRWSFVTNRRRLRPIQLGTDSRRHSVETGGKGMKWVSRRVWLHLAIAMTLALVSAPLSHASLGDKLKKKVTGSAEKKAEDSVDKATEDASKKADGEKGEQKEGDSAEKTDAPKGSGNVANVSTKFDFTPGDKLLFYDDFTQDELGEFPVHWSLKQGTFEVAEMSGQRCMPSPTPTSQIAMQAPAMPQLPEFWSLEFDWHCPKPSGNVLNLYGQKGDKQAWHVIFPYSGHNLYAESGKVDSDTP